MKRLFTKIAKWLGFFKTPTVTKVEQKKVDIFKGRTKEWDSEVIVKTKRLPKDANDIQKLDIKYNNSKSVYRDSKGRYASRNK
jgi:hypothetical protein|tara:strand:+ start:224 stop:472 length:249 start_codon:yes stop_codon:yes gene_type:complete